jgi:hypothetical protein
MERPPREQGDPVQTGYRFTRDHFTANLRGLRQVLAKLGDVANILEIGANEGRSTSWFIENVLASATGGRIVTIDNWWTGTFAGRHVDNSPAEVLFDHNMALNRTRFPNVQIEKMRLDSAEALVELLARGEAGRFDFVYVDGAHEAASVLRDLVLAFRLTRIGGLIACDDYLWQASRATVAGSNPLHFPKIAIDAFAAVYFDKLRPVIAPWNYQYYFQKIAD